MKKILISVVMPTYNSEKTIALALQSIRDQTFPQNQIEILVVDGGSTDKTLEVANKYNCTIIKNPDIQQEYAKHIGLLNAKGRCVMFLDSDEVLTNRNSILIKSELIIKKNAPIIFAGGYISPSNYSSVNHYINSVGDPFAFYMYGVIAEMNCYIQDMKKKYEHIEYKNYVKFFIKNKESYPLIDLCAGTTIDKKNLENFFPEVFEEVSSIPKIPYYLLSKSGSFSIVLKDGITHYSTSTLKRYLMKLEWRVLVNIFYKTIPGTGFSNRENFQPLMFKIKKYLFVPYSLSIILPFIGSLYLIYRKQKMVSLLHTYFCLYVMWKLVYYSIIKSLGVKPILSIYGK